MSRFPGAKERSVWAIVAVLSSCGQGGMDPGAGTDTDGENMDPPTPDSLGGECSDTVFGWLTTCLVDESIVMATDRREIPGVTPLGAHTTQKLCCEGRPSVETADEGCTRICRREACEAARIDHMQRCESCGVWDCGFDMSDCLEDFESEQIVSCLSPIGLPQRYTLTVFCSASNNEVRNPDGTFDFIQLPDNDAEDDPMLCNEPTNLDVEPPRGLGQFVGTEGAGTSARVSWTFAETEGEEVSNDLQAHLSYGLVPCGASPDECLEIASLILSLPTTEVLGMTLTNASLQVISVEQAPILTNGIATFAKGTLGVLLHANVDGIPLVLTGSTADPVHAILAPEDDAFSLTDLRFEFDDGIIAAALDVDIHGHYDVRAPNAEITMLEPSDSCEEPITMLATSWDPDQDPLFHRWWVRDVGTFQGSELEVVLGAGDHTVMLTTVDATGSWDTYTLHYTRICQ